MPYDYIPPVDIKTEPYIPETGEADRWDRQVRDRQTQETGSHQNNPCRRNISYRFAVLEQKQEVMSEWTHSEPLGTFRVFCGNLTDVPPTRQSLCSKQTQCQGEEPVTPSGSSQCRQTAARFTLISS